MDARLDADGDPRPRGGRRARDPQRRRRRDRRRDPLAGDPPAAARHRGDHPDPPHRLRHAHLHRRRLQGSRSRRTTGHQAAVGGRGVRRPRRGRPPVDRPHQGEPVHPATRTRCAASSTRSRPGKLREVPAAWLPHVGGVWRDSRYATDAGDYARRVVAGIPVSPPAGRAPARRRPPRARRRPAPPALAASKPHTTGGATRIASSRRSSTISSSSRMRPEPLSTT